MNSWWFNPAPLVLEQEGSLKRRPAANTRDLQNNAKPDIYRFVNDVLHRGLKSREDCTLWEHPSHRAGNPRISLCKVCLVRVAAALTGGCGGGGGGGVGIFCLREFLCLIIFPFSSSASGRKPGVKGRACHVRHLLRCLSTVCGEIDQDEPTSKSGGNHFEMTSQLQKIIISRRQGRKARPTRSFAAPLTSWPVLKKCCRTGLGRRDEKMITIRRF